MIRFFDPYKQYLQYKGEIDDAIQDTLERGDLILRQDVEEFEKNLAEFLGTKYAVGLNSGTDALFLSLKFLGVKEGNEVITVGHTFHATVEAIHNCGATPVLVNVKEDGMMDVDEVLSKINSKTKAIIPVHLMGDMVDMKALTDETDVPIIEDACQALGAELDGKKAGSWGWAGCFSFYPAKILGCFGDGGAITTNDEEFANELKDMRNHYKYNPGKWGFNSRLDNIQASILNVKIQYLEDMLNRRNEIALMYDDGLVSNGYLDTPKYRKGRVYQDYIIKTKERDELSVFLSLNNIETMKNDYYFPDDCPKPEETIELEKQTLRLPCNDVITDEEVREVIRYINEFFTK